MFLYCFHPRIAKNKIGDQGLFYLVKGMSIKNNIKRLNIDSIEDLFIFSFTFRIVCSITGVGVKDISDYLSQGCILEELILGS